MAGEPESLQQDEDLIARDRRHAYDRMIMLSDGVFAIAITLLAFDIRPPAGWIGRPGAAWAFVAPQLTSYVMSFLVVAFYWLVHRRFVAMMTRVDGPATAINLLVLGLVALAPAATSISESSHNDLSAQALYAALVILIGIALGLLWAYAVLRRLVFASVRRRSRWIGFLVPVVAPSLMLAATMGVRLPQDITPFVLIALFVPVWIFFQRGMHPSPPKAKAEA